MELPEDSAMLLTLQIDQRSLAASALVDLPASLEASCPIAAKKRSFAVSIKGYRKLLAYAPVFVFCLNVFSQFPEIGRLHPNTAGHH